MSMRKVVARIGVLAASLTLASVTWAHTEEAHEEGIDYSDVEAHSFGQASDPAKATHTIEIEMADTMRFTPAEITINHGDTVRFVVQNNGQLLHEMVLGTMDDLKVHSALMQKFPGMEHSEPYMAHVDVGGTKEMGWQFTNSGEFFFGCLQPGHFEAGMKGRIIVQ